MTSPITSDQNGFFIDKEIPLSDGRILKIATNTSGVPGSALFRATDGLRVLITRDGPKQQLHVSLSYQSSVPNDRTIEMVRAAFFGDAAVEAFRLQDMPGFIGYAKSNVVHLTPLDEAPYSLAQ